jgi:hypothetical protein
MLTDLDTFIQNKGGYTKHTFMIDGVLRSIETQQRLWDMSDDGGCKDTNGVKLNKCGNTAAPVGTSNHGWGIGIDFKWTTKNGGYTTESSRCTGKNDRWRSDQYEWLHQNSPNYGFANVGANFREVWHWEYLGTSIYDYMVNNPTSTGCNAVNVTWDPTKFKLNDIVKNPIDIETGIQAKFNTKSDKKTKADKTDSQTGS